jgi:hypothetical protein
MIARTTLPLALAVVAGGALLATGCDSTTPQPRVAAVVVTPDSAIVLVGESRQLAAETRGADGVALTGRTVTWLSLDTARLRVSAAGLVTASAPGVVQVVASSEGKGDTVPVTARFAIASVSVTPDTAIVAIGDSRQLTAVTRAADGSALTGRTVTWLSLDTARVRVSAAGLLTASAPGVAQVVASSEGKADTVPVTARYDDGFDTNRLSDYRAYDLSNTQGVWSMGGGTLTGNGFANQNVLIRNGSEIANGYVEARIVRADDAGLVFRFRDANSYYLLAIRDDAASLPRFASENLAFYRVYAQGFGVRFEEVWTRNLVWPRQGRVVRVEFEGPQFSIYVDGALVGQISDGGALYSTGGVGVRHMLNPDTSVSTNVFDWFRAGTL